MSADNLVEYLLRRLSHRREALCEGVLDGRDVTGPNEWIRLPVGSSI